MQFWCGAEQSAKGVAAMTCRASQRGTDERLETVTLQQQTLNDALLGCYGGREDRMTLT